LLYDSGESYPDGTYTILFKLYIEPNGASPSWTEKHTIDVKNGVFNLLLGQLNKINDSLFRNPRVWLEVNVVSINEEIPRRKIEMPTNSIDDNQLEQPNSVIKVSLDSKPVRPDTDNESEDKSVDNEPKITAFLSAYGGIFSVSFPEVEYDGELYGFEDIYGSKAGVSYGGEIGIGLGDIGLFFILKSRIWEISGKPLVFGNSPSIDLETTFEEQFLYIGGRYCFIGQSANSKAFLPFAGVGLVTGEASETWNGTIDGDHINETATVDASGYYLEGGAFFFLSPKFAVGAFAEYSKVTLKVPDYGGLYSDTETDGGGGISLNFTVNIFLGRAMKTP